MPYVVLVTAYDRYAVRAFEVEALDYLLKPFDADRFDQVLDRARRRLAERECCFGKASCSSPDGCNLVAVVTSMNYDSWGSPSTIRLRRWRAL